MENLSVCGYSGISSQQEFSRYGFNAHLQCTNGFDSWLNEIIDVKCLPFDDCVPIPNQILEHAYEWMSDHWEKDHRILVSCAAGESRSVSIAIGILKLKTELSFRDACKLCFSKIPSAYPHPQTLISVAKYCNYKVDVNQLQGLYNLIQIPPLFSWADREIAEAISLYDN
jgi:hypothetical protein